MADGPTLRSKPTGATEVALPRNEMK